MGGSSKSLKVILAIVSILAIVFLGGFIYEYRLHNTSKSTAKPDIPSTKTTSGRHSETVPLTTKSTKVTVLPRTDTTLETTTKTDGLFATNGEPFPYNDVRLPNDVTPLHYAIYMVPDLESKTFSGKVTIQIKVHSETSRIVMHTYKLEHKEVVTVYNDKNEIQPVDKFLQNLDNEQLYIGLDKPIEKGTYTLMMDFNGNLTYSLQGFYLSRIWYKNGTQSNIAVTQFEATDARRAFPCFDEPSMKAIFKMSILRKEEHISIFNTEVESTIEKDGMYLDTYENTLKMSSYLIAFAVGDLKKVTKKGKITINAYAPENQIDMVHFAIEVCADVIEFYNKFFGIEFPMKKMDLLALRDFAAGAMENWGLITFYQSDMLYEEGVTTYRQKQRVAVVVAHELAHQWFGDLVTMAWWSDIWLNEGFASYMEYQGTNHYAPKWRMKDQFLDNAVNSALQRDCYTNSHPIQVNVKNPNEIKSLFDTISYSKVTCAVAIFMGATVIRMIESFMGIEKMRAGLSAYLNKFKYSNAVTNDLWDSLSKQMPDIDVKSVMNTWTNQMGYPVVRISYDKKSGNVNASQYRFLLDAKRPHTTKFVSPYGYKWHIPLDYFTNENNNEVSTEWMNMKNITFKVEGNPAWLMMNKNHGGYYRIMYDNSNYRELLKQLDEDKNVFSPSDRAGLLMDILALHENKMIDTKVVMDMLTYLKHENDFLPWQISSGFIRNIGIHLKEIQYSMKKYMSWLSEILDESLKSIHWSPNSSLVDKKLMSNILDMGIYISHENTLQILDAMFKAFKLTGKLDMNLREYIYMVGVIEGGENASDFLLKRMQLLKKENTLTGNEAKDIVYALSSIKSKRLLQKLLEKAMDIKVMSREYAWYTILYCSQNELGRDITWRFFKDRWSFIKKNYGSNGYKMYYLITYLTSRFNTEKQYKEVKAFLTTHKAGGYNGEVATSRSLVKIKKNINWIVNEGLDIIEWLDDNRDTPRR